MSALQYERLRELLARAGLDRVLAPQELIAAQVVAAAAGAFVVLIARASGALPAWLGAPAALLGAALPRIALRDRAARRRHAILRQLPHDIDLITLAVEAGLNLGAALGQAAQHGPPGPLRDEWRRLLRDVRAGQPRHEALHALAARLAVPAVSSVVAALLAAERQGASLAPILRAQAEQRRTERFLRAERLAMEAPVKMLFPLVLCIFPGTFAILLFPVVHQLLSEGVL
ncbi:MAG: type II secretion system F family protein [Burkholderiaceae bacterium]|nr:type II secretion system F family protein [Burkholderiaceae bacterium]